jgi:hypothetical protein
VALIATPVPLAIRAPRPAATPLTSVASAATVAALPAVRVPMVLVGNRFSKHAFNFRSTDPAVLTSNARRLPRQWIEPFQSPETGKIAVGRAQCQAVLDRECGEVRVRDEIAVHAGFGEEFAEHFGVPFGWQRYPYRLAIQPL